MVNRSRLVRVSTLSIGIDRCVFVGRRYSCSGNVEGGASGGNSVPADTEGRQELGCLS